MSARIFTEPHRGEGAPWISAREVEVALTTLSAPLPSHVPGAVLSEEASEACKRSQGPSPRGAHSANGTLTDRGSAPGWGVCVAGFQERLEPWTRDIAQG